MNWVKVILIGVIATTGCIVFDAWVMGKGAPSPATSDASTGDSAPNGDANGAAGVVESATRDEDEEDATS